MISPSHFTHHNSCVLSSSIPSSYPPFKNDTNIAPPPPKLPPPLPIYALVGMASGGDRCPRQGQPPCGACKFLRRKCTASCVFAPHFGSEQGAARFAAVHKVFGASNVSRLLARVPAGRRNDAVVTVCYEAQARIADPVYGCVSAILALQHQVALLQAELSIVQSQLINSRLAFAATNSPQLQPAFSNSSSSAPNNSADFAGLPSSALDLADSDPSSSPQGLDLEEDSKDPIAFANFFLHRPK